MIVLDANVIIAHHDTTNALHDRATGILLAHADDSFGASVITIAECLVGPVRVGRRDQFQTFLDALDISVVPVPDDAAEQLAELRAGTGLKMPDCCVITAAQQLDAQIATLDVRLAAAAHELGIPIIDG